MSNKQQLCTFHVGDLYLGIDVQQIQEVIRFQRMTRVPLAPASIRGLINLRGQIVTAIDLRYPLGLPSLDPDTLPMNIVVKDGDSVVSLLVDRIGDVVEVGEYLFEPPPATLQEDMRRLVLGAYKLSGCLLLALDVNRALEATEQTSLTLTA